MCMNWRGYSPTKKGAWMGFFLTLVVYVIAAVMVGKLIIVDNWDGLVSNAGGELVPTLGWVFIMGFLVLLIATMMAVTAGVALLPLGALLGWLYGKVTGSSSPTTPINTSYLPKQ